jgi:predicted RNA binding protein YcfA (HicA-like mRNA interferase family)
MNNFTPAVIRILRKNGWEFLRHGDGDHDIWWHPGTRRKVSVDSKIKSRHSANGVLKQAGLPKAL